MIGGGDEAFGDRGETSREEPRTRSLRLEPHDCRSSSLKHNEAADLALHRFPGKADSPKVDFAPLTPPNGHLSPARRAVGL